MQGSGSGSPPVSSPTCNPKKSMQNAGVYEWEENGSE